MQVLRCAAQREFAAIISGLQVIRVTAYLTVLYQYINNLYSKESCNGVARGDERSRDDDRCFLGSSKIGHNSCIVCFYWHSHAYSLGSEIYIVSLFIVVLHGLLLGFLGGIHMIVNVSVLVV